MLLCMRTTIDLDDALAIRAKKAAVERRSSLRALVEQGLNVVLASSSEGRDSPVDELAGLGKESWKGVHPDRYVRESRKGWG